MDPLQPGDPGPRFIAGELQAFPGYILQVEGQLHLFFHEIDQRLLLYPEITLPFPFDLNFLYKSDVQHLAGGIADGGLADIQRIHQVGKGLVRRVADQQPAQDLSEDPGMPQLLDFLAEGVYEFKRVLEAVLFHVWRLSYSFLEPVLK